VADIDLRKLIDFHWDQQVLATLTAVQPPGRFGAFHLDRRQTGVTSFHEKPKGDVGGAWVNGGFFVLEPQILQYIDGDATVWEKGPLERLAAEHQLAAYRHEGFWQPMDTLRDKNLLEELWLGGSPPWRTWK
jgi:glucose-1-phosphate cytidylyltransferase